jgi:hypothetical protein
VPRVSAYPVGCPDGNIQEAPDDATPEQVTALCDGHRGSATHECGGVKTSIDIGCRGQGNPISLAIYAIIRFLSVGVGLVVIGSIIMAGIQFTSSQGNPQATAAAQKRIASTVGALLLYILAYALLNWLVPGGLFL